MSYTIPLEPAFRAALLAFAGNRKPDEMRKSLTFFHDEEPDLVPEGKYAVVVVEYRDLPDFAEKEMRYTVTHTVLPVGLVEI